MGRDGCYITPLAFLACVIHMTKFKFYSNCNIDGCYYIPYSFHEDKQKNQFTGPFRPNFIQVGQKLVFLCLVA